MIDILVHLIVRFFFKEVFPYKSEKSYGADELRELKRRYGKWKGITIVLTIIFLTGLLVFNSFALIIIYQFSYKFFLGSGTIFYPIEEVYFLFPGILLSVTSFSYLITFIQKLFIKNYSEFESYMNYMTAIENGFDNKKASLAIPRICLYSALILLAFVFNAKLLIKRNEIIYNKPFDLSEKVHTFNDISRIVLFDRFKEQVNTHEMAPHCLVFFKNGDRLETQNYPEGRIGINPMSLTDIFVQQSKVMIEKFETDPR